MSETYGKIWINLEIFKYYVICLQCYTLLDSSKHFNHILEFGYVPPILPLQCGQNSQKFPKPLLPVRK